MISEEVRAMARFLFNTGYPFNMVLQNEDGQVLRDDEGKPIIPPVVVMDALIEEWRTEDARTGEFEQPLSHDGYRELFEEELGVTIWAEQT